MKFWLIKRLCEILGCVYMWKFFIIKLVPMPFLWDIKQYLCAEVLSGQTHTFNISVRNVFLVQIPESLQNLPRVFSGHLVKRKE